MQRALQARHHHQGILMPADNLRLHIVVACGILCTTVSLMQPALGVPVDRAGHLENPSEWWQTYASDHLQNQAASFSAAVAGNMALATTDDMAKINKVGDTLSILMELFHSTNGDSWFKNDNWTQLSNNPPCDWYGIVCNDFDSVTEIYLDSNNLDGELPEVLGNLLELTVLRLTHNFIRGALPDMSATNVVDIDVSYNMLSWLGTEFPQSLRELHADVNRLGSGVTKALDVLNTTGLELFDVRTNGYCGVLPSGWTLKQYQFVDLSENPLFCPLPDFSAANVSAQCLGASLYALTPAAIPNLGSPVVQMQVVGMRDYYDCMPTMQWFCGFDWKGDDSTVVAGFYDNSTSPATVSCRLNPTDSDVGIYNLSLMYATSELQKKWELHGNFLQDFPTIEDGVSRSLPGISLPGLVPLLTIEDGIEVYPSPVVESATPQTIQTLSAVTLTISGQNFAVLNSVGTDGIQCRFQTVDNTTRISTRGTVISTSLLSCVVPALRGVISDGTADLCVDVTLNGQDYSPSNIKVRVDIPSASKGVDWALILGVALPIALIAILGLVIIVYLRRKAAYSAYTGGLSSGNEPLLSKLGVTPKGSFKDAWNPSFDINPSDLKLVRRLGHGSHGAVWLATWRHTSVAVKKCTGLQLEDVQGFEKECKLLSRLNHPNVIRFFGVARDSTSMLDAEGSLYLVTEFMQLGSMWDVLHLMTLRPSWVTLLSMARDAAQGMAYLHSLEPPILHRDLKTLNLLVDQSYNVKVADFGIARASSNDTMTFCGTPKWTAPEVLRMNSYSEKADVYSFGIVLWELVTCEEPYGDLPAMQVVVRVINEGLRPAVPLTVDRDYSELMKECWAEAPEHRPSFDMVVKRLDEMIACAEAEEGSRSYSGGSLGDSSEAIVLHASPGSNTHHTGSAPSSFNDKW